MAGQKCPHLQSPEFEVRLGRPFMIALRAWNEFRLHVRCSPAPTRWSNEAPRVHHLLGGAVAWPLAARAAGRAGAAHWHALETPRDARELPRGNRDFRAGIDLAAYVSFEPGQTKAFDNILPLPLARE